MRLIFCLFSLVLSSVSFGFPNVLILSFPVGSGHLVPSQGLKALILEKYPDANVRIENSTKFYPMHEKEERSRVDGYLDSVKEGKLNAKSDYGKFILRPFKSLLVSGFDQREFVPYLRLNKIDIIVTTIYRDALGLAKLKSMGLVRAKITWIVTDYMVYPYQDIPPLIDMTFVGDLFLEREYKKISGQDTPVMGAGIPLSARKFKNYKQQDKTRDDVIDIGVAGGGEGIGKFSILGKEAIDFYIFGKGKNKKIKFHFFAGRNQDELERIKDLEKNYPDLIQGYGPLSNLDFLEKITKMDYYLTKPGGASTTEASIMGLPMILLRPIGSPEYGNLQHFLKNKMAVDFEGPGVVGIKNFGERVEFVLKNFEKNVDRGQIRKWSDSYDPSKIVDWMARQKRESKDTFERSFPALETMDNFWSAYRKAEDSAKINSPFQVLFEKDLNDTFNKFMGNKALQSKETTSGFCDKSRIYFSHKYRFKGLSFSSPSYKNVIIGTPDTVIAKTKFDPNGSVIISEEKMNCYIASSKKIQEKIRLIQGQLKAILNFNKKNRKIGDYEKICNYLKVITIILRDLTYIADFSDLGQILKEELEEIENRKEPTGYYYHLYKGYVKFLMGLTKFNSKNFAAAVPLLKDAFLEDVNIDMGLDFLVKSLEMSSNISPEESLSQILKRSENPKDFYVYYLRAILEKRKGNRKAMMENFNKALEWNYRDPGIFFMLDSFSMLLKEWIDEHPYFFTRMVYDSYAFYSSFDIWIRRGNMMNPVNKIADEVRDNKFLQRIVYNTLVFEPDHKIEQYKEEILENYPWLLSEKIKKLFEKRLGK